MNDPFTTNADSTALPGAGAPACAGGNHKCNGKSGCLCQQSDCHERGRCPRSRLGANAVGEQRNIERAVRAIDQGSAQQIKYRADQREKHIAQGRPDRFLVAFHADKRHRRKGQQFQRNIEVEKVVAERHCVQPAPDAQQQSPERVRSARDLPVLLAKLAAGIERDGANDHGYRQYHRRRNPISAQRYPEGRLPIADNVDKQLIASQHRCKNCDRHAKPYEQKGQRYALDKFSTERQRQQDAHNWQDDGQDQQISVCGCGIDRWRRVRHHGRAPCLPDSSGSSEVMMT